MEPLTPETPQDPTAPEGTPVTAGAADPTAADTTQPGRAEATGTGTPAPVNPPPAADDTATRAEPVVLPAEVAELEQSLRGRTEDLQRLQAEYVNYKRRVDRDRDVAKNAGIEAVVTDLMSVLDNLRTAREHEEMTAGLRLLVDELDRITVKYGLETYGSKGEVFDPTIHEALMQAPMPGVTEPTVLEVVQVGYRFRGRVIRPARVAVGMPAAGEPAASAGPRQANEADGSAEASESTEITEPVRTAETAAAADTTATDRVAGEAPGR